MPLKLISQLIIPWKSIKTGDISTGIEINNNWKKRFLFFKIVPLLFNSRDKQKMWIWTEKEHDSHTFRQEITPVGLTCWSSSVWGSQAQPLNTHKKILSPILLHSVLVIISEFPNLQILKIRVNFFILSSNSDMFLWEYST